MTTTVTTCPYCHAVDAVDRLIEFCIPARTTYTNRSAQLLQCQRCQQVFMSMYEEEPVDQSNPAAWNAYFYYLPQALQHDLLIDATLCVTPDNAACHCAMHQLISELDFSQLQRLP
ncbi:MAG TPA: hypothetical protein DEG44_05810 [Candidatus Kerfeldbacteria bacterium]|nr:hypothetical protein [Candidatus Kerfeldbacteria bacterium]